MHFQNNIALGRLVSTLREICDDKLPKDQIFINGYLMFEALTMRDYDFSCNLCGFHPDVLCFDLCKKTAFDFKGITHMLIW